MDSLPGLTDLTYYRGRVALFAILKALGVGRGDDVVLQAFTCVAVPEAIMATGGRPLYVDLEPNGSFNMDARDLAEKLSIRTRAIVVQHTFGIPARMDQILEVARDRNLAVVEDCCHSLLSTYRAQTVGRFGVASFYSWEWGKPIVVGIGGSAVANDPVLRQRLTAEYADLGWPAALKRLRLQLQYVSHRLLYRPRLYWPIRTLYRRLGSLGAAQGNYNPLVDDRIADDFSLRMAEPLRQRLIRKLRRLPQQTRHSRQVTDEYTKRITSELVRHPTLPAGSDSVFARYPLQTASKSELLQQARRLNVELADWYAQPVHPISRQQWPTVGYEAGSCPRAEEMCGRVVTLPTHPAVTRRDVDRTVRFFDQLDLQPQPVPGRDEESPLTEAGEDRHG